MSLLNNTFNQISIPKPDFNLTTRVDDNRSPRGIRSLNLESNAPFTITGSSYPNRTYEDREERV